ncbi:PIG-L family deacetylase [uncultured Meiothermus sp.]|jgi:LmbE family N-acetylglucosaminyl deacetylase|uniref:PIG-L deacetylase family protein n=1 Tax=uncultured Meiothermus sp. TaxID=157471 RepID=UPI0026267EE8|nr:PIG-L family deacetylase [uncultured Meiothermus sp.]
MKTILMLATYGLEIVEVGGTLALHAQAGDAVHAAVVLSRPQTRPQVEQAAQILGVKSVQFLDFQTGETQLDTPSKTRLVRLIRETRPDLLITQDPEHSYADLDPDRRLLMLLYLEAAALAGREWRVEECGGFRPHLIRDLYYMSPENPNCVVEIGATFALKQQALQVLEGQLAFTAQLLRGRLDPASLQTIVPDYAALGDLELGRALHREMDKSLALYHGLLSHAGATLAEAFRHQFPFRLERLL